MRFYSTAGADFRSTKLISGGGKPVWVSIARLPAGNSAVLIDTRDGDGIEAWISLDEKDMAVFQQDQDIDDYVV